MILPAALATSYLAYVTRGRLSRNFTVMELVSSESGGTQWPGPLQLYRLRALAVNLLQPWRDIVGPLVVTSGYRTGKLNERIVGASQTSDHLRGRAADVVPIRGTIRAAANTLVDSGIPFDQLIVYPGHIHVGYRGTANRRQIIGL